MKKNERMKRFSKYDMLIEPRLSTIEAFRRDGLSEEQIAENLGVAYSTFRNYRDEKPALQAVLKKGFEDAIAHVENEQFKLCTGYEYEERKEVFEVDAEGKQTGKKRIEIITKRVQPNVTAQIFYLKNRKPDKWSDRKEISNDTTEYRGIKTYAEYITAVTARLKETEFDKN